MLLGFGEFFVRGNAVPFVQAAAAAAGGRVHSLENGMPVHRGLFSVIQRLGGGELLLYKIPRVAAYYGGAFFFKIPPFFFRQMKTGTEFRFFKFVKRFVNCLHGF